MAFWDLTPPSLCLPHSKALSPALCASVSPPWGPPGIGDVIWWHLGVVVAGGGTARFGDRSCSLPPPPQLQHRTPLPPLLTPPVRLTLVTLHWPFRPFYFLGVSHAAWGLNGEGGGDGGQHLLTTPQLGMCVWGGVRPCTVLSWCRSAPGAEGWTRGGSDPPRPLGVGRIS